MAVASAGLYASLHPMQTTTPTSHHSVFYRPDALPDAQSTASKHWRHSKRLGSVMITTDHLVHRIMVRVLPTEISVWTIHRWNLRFIGFPKMYSSSRLMLGFESNWQKCNSWHTQNGHSTTWCISGDMQNADLWTCGPSSGKTRTKICGS